MEYLFFKDWDGIIRVAVTTVLAYLIVILMLRISGKRTLAKMNAFDFVVTIALGSVLGAIILNKSITLAEGTLALVLLVFLQFGLTYLSARNKRFKNLISNQPSFLFYNDTLFTKTIVAERISMEEIKKAVRAAGYSSFCAVQTIVLETTGDLSVIGKNAVTGEGFIFEEVKNFHST